MSSMYISWLIFSCNLWSLYPPVHFFGVWLSGIIVITNSNGDSASLWKITFWIFAAAKLFPPTVSSTLQFFMVFSIRFMTSSDILCIYGQSIIQLCGTISYTFLYPIHATSCFALLEDVLINISLVPLQYSMRIVNFVPDSCRQYFPHHR